MKAKLFALTVPVLVAGVVCASLITPSANAWDVNSPPTGFQSEHHTDSAATSCSEYYVLIGYGAVSGHLCTDSPTFQQDVDAFVNANCPPAICAPPTTTTTDTAPATTTTDTQTQPATDPVTTDPVTVTTDAAAPTTTVSSDDLAQIKAELVDLEQRLVALSKRVDAIEDANKAAWNAYVVALQGGASPVSAALAARSAGLNALYGGPVSS